MFRPNSIGTLAKLTGWDKHAREEWAADVPCPFAPVNLNVRAQKTPVRADSSASRGAADEEVSPKAQVLIVPALEPKIGDRFTFNGVHYQLMDVHPRFTVFGKLDHYDCMMEVMP